MNRLLLLPLLLLLSHFAFAQSQASGTTVTKGAAPFTPTTIHLYCGPVKPNLPPPLYVVNGKPLDKFQLSSLNPNQIDSISILKGAAATARYGDLGKYGVVIVKIKQD